MSELEDLKGQLRAASFEHELERAQRSISLGPVGLFVKVALSIVFMYLVFISYMMMGISGPISVSLFFLAALIVPALYQWTRHVLTAVSLSPIAAHSLGNTRQRGDTDDQKAAQSTGVRGS